MINLIIQD